MTDARISSHWSLWNAQVVLAALFILNLYRAATQSFTFDEASTYLNLVDAPWREMSEVVNTNNHFLLTLLMRLSAMCFGHSEFALRLPSVLGGLLFFVSVWHLCRIVFREGVLFLLAVVVTAANPFVLDFMVAARGYGLGVALFMFALWQATRYFQAGNVLRWRLAAVGAGLVLSITANNVMLWPAVVLTLAMAVLYWRNPPAGERRSKWIPPLAAFLSPVLILSYLYLLFSPILLARKADYAFLSLASIPPGEAWSELVEYSLAHNSGIGGFNAGSVVRGARYGLEAHADTTPPNSNPVLQAVRWLIGFAVIPAAFSAVWFGWKKRSAAAFLAAASLTGTVLVTVFLYYAIDLPLPKGRHGIFLLPLAGFALAAAAQFALREAGRPRAASGSKALAFGVAGRTFFACTLLVAVFYCDQINWTHFAFWKYDADTRDLLLVLQPRAQQLSRTVNRPVSLGGSWFYLASSNFYRVTKNWSWLQPVGRGEPADPHDFYLLLNEDRDVVSRLNLEVIAVGRIYGTILAARR